MPVKKANEPLKQKPPIILIYGPAGIAKTSIANTTNKPVVIDFDRGVDRSILRKDVIEIDTWEELLKDERDGAFKDYETIIIDTAKAALDDFLMPFVVRQNSKLAFNKLEAYGQIGDSFKVFINNRRAEKAAIFIVAHMRKDEDTKKLQPDITGQSLGLIMRIASQVGYVHIEGNQRVISWDVSEQYESKNTAGLAKTIVPDKNDAAFKTFGQSLIDATREALEAQTEEQREAEQKAQEFTDNIAGAQEPHELTLLASLVAELPDYLKIPLRIQFTTKAESMGWLWVWINKETKEGEYQEAPKPEGDAGAGDGAATTPPGGDEKSGKDEKGELTPEGSKQGPLKPAALPFPEMPTGLKKSEIIKYDTIPAFTGALERTDSLDQYANLYHKNTHLIEGNDELTALCHEHRDRLEVTLAAKKAGGGKNA